MVIPDLLTEGKGSQWFCCNSSPFADNMLHPRLWVMGGKFWESSGCGRALWICSFVWNTYCSAAAEPLYSVLATVSAGSATVLTAHGVPAETLCTPDQRKCLLPPSSCRLQNELSFSPPIHVCPPLDASVHSSQACLCIEQRILYWVIVYQFAKVSGGDAKRTFHATIPLTSLLWLLKHTVGPCAFNMSTAGQLFKT